MAQHGIPYRLTGPDGTVVVFNDPTDPDFIGYLDADNGITGLLDSPDVREGYFDKPEAHGGVQTRNLYSRRVGTLQGVILPEPNWLTYNQRESSLKRASRGLEGSAPSILTWTPDGRDTMMMRLYRQGKIAISGRRPKNFVVPLSSPDAFLVSAALNSQGVSLEEESGDAGFSSPIKSPLGTVYKATAHVAIINAGDAEAWPEFIIKGPIINPLVVNDTTGLKWQLTCNLGAGESLYINSFNRTVLLKSTEETTALVNRYSYFAANFSTNTWWPLEPGANDVRVLPTPFVSGAAATVLWRDSWE
jgi:hypothetical protein